MRILFVGGGSIGHIAPSVAVWRAVEKLNPQAECHFLCSERMEEAEFLRKEKLSFTQLPGRKLRITRPWEAWQGIQVARRLINAWKPDVLFSKGGSLSIPATWIAKRKNIPVILHESDAVMGRANTMIAKWASIVCLGFPQQVSGDGLRVTSHPQPATRNSQLLFTGNPIRPEIPKGSRAEGWKLTGLEGKKPILLVAGGSQGALALNDAIRRHLAELLQIVEIVHLTGKGKPGAGMHAGYWSREFAQEELPHLYAMADLALSRSGAGGIGELAACGIPALLVPLRGLAQDHQLWNAKAAERSGGCIVLEQETLDGTLVDAVTSLVTDNAKRERMRAAIQSLHAGDAAKTIAEILVREASKKS